MELRRDPTSENPDLYESKMALFYNGDQEAFLFAHNFKITLEASGMLQDAAKIQYLRMLVRGEALRQFGMMYADFESSTPLTLEAIFGIGYIHFLVNALSKQKRAIRRGIRKPYGLKLRCCVARLIDLNEYLPSFPGSTPAHKIGMTELNEILLNSMPNSRSKQAYVQGFDWKYITSKNLLTCLNAWM